MQYLFAITYEPEMPGFYNTCMHWSYAHFMKFFAINTKKRVILNCLGFINPVFRITNRFQPWMICIINSEVFMYFALKSFKRQVFCRKGIKHSFTAYYCGGNHDIMLNIICNAAH